MPNTIRSATCTTNTTFGSCSRPGSRLFPYKLITITAGVFRLDLPMFVFASIVSRGLRFVLISWLIWKYGAPIKTFIDKYFNLLAIGFTVLLVGGFFAIKYAF